MSRIENLVFDTGERYPILLGDNDIPNYWVTLYVTEILRPLQTQSAMINTIGHLIHLKLWEEINNRNLIEELSQAKFLSDEDIYSLRDHCMQDTRSLKKWHKSSNHNIVRFASASTASVTPIQSVSAPHASNRMAHIASF
ncbi:[weak similarity to] phage integrase family protein, partial [methanotrophic bacterial endosymbiont of Bathymodiolus sp.]